MNDQRREQIYQNLVIKETADLLDIWQNGKVGEWDEIAFEIVKDLLVERLGYLPPRSIENQISKILESVDDHLENNELDVALREVESAIQLNPNFALAYNYRGEIYEEMGQLEIALSNYQEAIRLDPGLRDAWEAMLDIEPELEEAFNQSEAKQHLDQALVYAEDDEPEKALAECEAAKPLLPGIASAYNDLGLVYHTLGQFELAIDAYQKAIQLNPHFYAARENLAVAKLRWEEDQYHIFSNLSPAEPQEEFSEVDESQISESNEILPQWLYKDERAFLLAGWAGHRTRQGRSGYDPLDNDFEWARTQGIIIRQLLQRKFRTRNPIYLIFMAFVGVLFFLYGAAPVFVLGNLSGIITGIIYIPYTIAGILLLVNVILSLGQNNSAELEDNGAVFF